MELLVLRHGKSSWSDPMLEDYKRPLKKRGKRDAARMGLFLRDQALLPDLILASTAERAAQTTRRFLRAAGLSASLVTWSRNFYHAVPDTWLAALAMVPEHVGTVLLVGHNPGLEDLIETLCRTTPAREADGKLLPTAALAHLTLPEPWSAVAPGTAAMRRLVRPRTLPDAPD